jgi:hypothetical protein
MFPEELIQEVKSTLVDIKNATLKSQTGHTATSLERSAYNCLADRALEYAPPKLPTKIVVDVETVCNRIGTFLVRQIEDKLPSAL